MKFAVMKFALGKNPLYQQQKNKKQYKAFATTKNRYREFLPYANFITANFITAVFQNYY